MTCQSGFRLAALEAGSLLHSAARLQVELHANWPQRPARKWPYRRRGVWSRMPRSIVGSPVHQGAPLRVGWHDDGGHHGDPNSRSNSRRRHETRVLFIPLVLVLQGPGCAMRTAGSQGPRADLVELGRLHDTAEEGLRDPDLTEEAKRHLQDSVAGRCNAIAGNHVLRAEGRVPPPRYSARPAPQAYDVEKPLVPTQRGLLTIREVSQRCSDLSNPFLRREEILVDDPHGRRSILTREQVWEGWPYKEETYVRHYDCGTPAPDTRWEGNRFVESTMLCVTLVVEQSGHQCRRFSTTYRRLAGTSSWFKWAIAPESDRVYCPDQTPQRP